MSEIKNKFTVFDNFPSLSYQIDPSKDYLIRIIGYKSLYKNQYNPKVIKKFKDIPKVMIFSDLHIQRDNPKGFKIIKNFIKNNNVKAIISRTSMNIEFIKMKKIITEIPIYVIEHPINPIWFNDFHIKKDIDIFMCGNDSPNAYPLRHKIKQMLIRLKKETKLRIVIKTYRNPLDRKKVGIPRQKLGHWFNRSWLSVVTNSKYNYLVKKYFEISASKSVILGNMPSQGQPMFGENYIQFNKNLTYQQFKKKILKNLRQKEKLIKMAEHNYNIIHNNYLEDLQKEKLNKIYNNILYLSNSKQNINNINKINNGINNTESERSSE